VIVADFFDTGQSRTLAWPRRPQTAALVAQRADPDPGWDAIVIGEYERAFYGNRYAWPARRRRRNLPTPPLGGSVRASGWYG
jgi:hypothetical protein